MAVPTPFAMEWCRSQHEAAWVTKTGDAFEDHITHILRVFHDDFHNPSPAGNLGDRKCDGIADSGKIFYACYGSRQQEGSTESAIVTKIRTDFTGAVAQWPTFEEWRFVTNSRSGPNVAALIITLQNAHGSGSARPLRVRLWSSSEDLWNRVISKMSQEQLDLVFPGRPGLARVELSDLEPLLDVLNSSELPEETATNIKEVPLRKMEFNKLSAGTRIEINSGRRLAPRMDAWYFEQGDPDLYDRHGARFRRIYLEHESNHLGHPTEIMEGIYQSLAGEGYRLNDTLANSVYTVTSYFFDQCHIFETPPEGWGEVDVITD